MLGLRLLCLTALAPAIAGCLTDDDIDTARSAVVEGSPEAIGILRFLNGPDATFEVLDIDAALDVRAARNIVDHLAGADGVRGTADDDAIDDLDELDAIRWVGDATIARIVAYVDSIGGIPSIVVEGVALTTAEADAIVAVANGANKVELDIDAGLDARATLGLMAARPLADIDAVAAAYWVGPSALDKLRVYAPTWTPSDPEPPAECDLSIARRFEYDTAAFDELLALATTRDWPYAEMIALQANLCLGLDDAAGRDALADELVLHSGLDWQYGPGVYPAVDNLYRGSDWFLRRMSSARETIELAVVDGDWDPNASPETAALWGNLDAIYSNLTARATARPDDFYQVRLFIDNEECSQDAIALVDAADYRIWIIHRFPGC